MRYLEVSVHHVPDDRHPMHQFVVEHEAYEITRLLSRFQYSDTEQAALFHVEGPVEPYEHALAEQSSIQEFELSPCQDTSFYLYVREEMRPDSREFADAFSQPGLIVLTPIEYRADGTVRLTAIGPAETVQAAVSAVPETMGVEVCSVGKFALGRLDPRLELTQRQFDAVSEAVARGYYSEPRSATLDDVAAGLDCSSGTAGELLRRAERTVMTHLVNQGPF
jgi:hypothetical protein